MNPNSKIEDIFRLKPEQKKALKKLRLETAEDLLRHFPAHYSDPGERTETSKLKPGEKVILYGTLSGLKARKGWKSKIPMAEGTFEDAEGKIKVIWFNQPYIAKMAPEKTPIKLEGKISERGGRLAITNPEIERIPILPEQTKSMLYSDRQAGKQEYSILPTYRESRGITSRWFFHAIQKIIGEKLHEALPDPVPAEILKRYNLPTLRTALVWIHNPKNAKEAKAARKRFAFEEVFLIQIANQRIRQSIAEEPSFEIKVPEEKIKAFTDRFPFTPTGAQTRAVGEILKDFETSHAMSRLLEGDVGSGKTFVAATTAHAVVTTPPKGRKFGNLQVAYMAPTEILANQHFESFIEYFSHLPINIGLITGSGCKKFPSKVSPTGWTNISRSQFLKWVESGDIPIVIGTHALIQKSVKFKHLAYVIIDEQHRFGVRQRKSLASKQKEIPHLLSMTATPIPRTLALTIYGDLDLSLLDENPVGRKEVETKLVPPSEREQTYEEIRKEISSGRQAFVICPRIEAPDPEKENALQLRSVEEETERLRKEVFPELSIESLHGKMLPKDKEGVMKKFEAGDIDILVSTSVVEVGVNVPNATIIVIEGADRFGLAQLHQLRGRVKRSSYQARCFLFTDSKSKISRDRLKALGEAKSGFELAELDLSLRGAGELTGGRQWGISDVGMEAIRNLDMVTAARKEAEVLVKKDPDLKKLPELKEKSDKYQKALHME
jgi:ATP-dependent DNA helicase RecG